MLRILHPSDLAQVLAIEQSVHLVPWAEETFRTCFEFDYIGWVIEIDKNVIGFILASLRIDECHVLNLCVAPNYQHQGWGRQLLEQVLHHAKQRGADIVYLEVRRSNTHAILLYQKMQFHLIGERKGYYPTVAGNEDALVFAKSLNEIQAK